MSSITRRNGFVFVAAIGLGLMVTSARGGNLDSPAAPTNPASAMFTLSDIYTVLDTRTTNVTLRTGGFAEPTGGPTNGTMHTLNDIMTLVTNRAPVGKTGQTASYTTSDDGALKIGVAWPNPRFSPVALSGDATNQIRDNLTGLIWARDASNACNFGTATVDWTTAVQACTNLNYGGTNDWRLPNVNELHSLINFKYASPAISDGTGTNQWSEALGPFTGVKSGNWYWSSTYNGYNGPSRENVVDPGNAVISDLWFGSGAYVWPVRGGR